MTLKSTGIIKILTFIGTEQVGESDLMFKNDMFWGKYPTSELFYESIRYINAMVMSMNSDRPWFDLGRDRPEISYKAFVSHYDPDGKEYPRFYINADEEGNIEVDCIEGWKGVFEALEYFECDTSGLTPDVQQELDVNKDVANRLILVFKDGLPCNLRLECYDGYDNISLSLPTQTV